jgi:DNA-binding response OmpR family regulator
MEYAMLTYLLLVEDDEKTRTTIGRLLEKQGYCVTTAHDGNAALEQLTKHYFDIVITDIHLGAIDGFHVLQCAKNQERPPSTIVLTGDTTLETAVKALRAGADDYLVKPCSSEELLMRLRTVAKKHETELVRMDVMRTVVQMADQLRMQPMVKS